jgi:hypothetical protein
MGRCEFPQPRRFSGEGGKTGLAKRLDWPCPEGAVRPAWLGGSLPPQNSGRSGFRGGESSGFSSGGRGVGGWSGESAGGQFARRSPPIAQYRDGKSRSFEMERRDGPLFSFRGFGPPPGREGWFPHGGYRGDVRSCSFGRKDVLDCANPTFEQMARRWFYSLGTNPYAESFVRSRARF